MVCADLLDLLADWNSKIPASQHNPLETDRERQLQLEYERITDQ